MEPTLRPGSVKICGLREPEHAVTAARAGADLLGFIFAPSRRYVAPEDARVAIDAARASSSDKVRAVGVFVNEPPERINEVARIAGLDLIQLSGDEPTGIVEQLSHPYVRGLRPPTGATAAEVSAHVNRWLPFAPAAFLLDGYHPGQFGGTGIQSDWLLATELARGAPVLLAGGLTPGNVGDAISRTQPIGVDVSSGVEIDGHKDHDAIEAFIREAKAAFRSLGV